MCSPSQPDLISELEKGRLARGVASAGAFSEPPNSSRRIRGPLLEKSGASWLGKEPRHGSMNRSFRLSTARAFRRIGACSSRPTWDPAGAKPAGIADVDPGVAPTPVGNATRDGAEGGASG